MEQEQQKKENLIEKLFDAIEKEKSCFVILLEGYGDLSKVRLEEITKQFVESKK